MLGCKQKEIQKQEAAWWEQRYNLKRERNSKLTAREDHVRETITDF